jgi:hypothetical protein
LTGIEIWNRGKGKLFFTGADGNTVTYGPIDGPQWNPDSPPGSMGHFKIDATSTNCMVNYTFR